MKAHEIIDRLASLDEQAPVEEPQVEPDVLPEEPAVEPREPAPRRGPRRDPYTVPPDFEPGQMPRPKAQDEGSDDMASIQSWLEATQQPIQDWEWDGSELRLLMDDGSTEVYTRPQLEQTGVFSGEMAMAESRHFTQEDVEAAANAALEHDDGEAPGPGPFGPPAEEVVVDGPPPDVEEFVSEAPPDEAAGVLDQLLGRASSAPASPEDGAGEAEVIHVEGDEAEELTAAVSDVVNAILGIVQKDSGEKTPDSEPDSEPKKKKSDDEKDDKPKKEKDEDEDDDEKPAKKDAKEDNEKE
jgi:hypothetical protein